MHKFYLLAGSLSGAISVMIGAFGAHGLKNFLTANGRMEVFETAVKYQFYHSFALLVTGILMIHMNDKLAGWAGNAFIAGMVIFSGSLYILCLTNVGKWGAVTPIGGLLLIAGWILLGISIYRSL